MLIVHNELAGMRRQRLLRHVCRALEASGAHLEIVSADSAEMDRRLAEKAVSSRSYDAVVAAGGDSTIRGIGAGLRGSNLPLGIIPVGTGNVLAEEINFRGGPQTIAHNLMYGPSVPIFGGVANGAHFFAMASAGFDARILARLDMGWKRRLGKLAYVLPSMLELTRQPTVFEAVIDEKAYCCSWLIVAKASHYAGPFVLSRRWDINSDGFHAVIVSASSRASLLSVALAIAVGRVASHPDVTVVACRQVLIRGQTGILTQLDGEIFGGTPLRIEADTAPLQIVRSM